MFKVCTEKSAVALSDSPISTTTYITRYFLVLHCGVRRGSLASNQKKYCNIIVCQRECTSFWTDFNMLPVIMILDDMINRSLLSTSDYNTTLSWCQKYTSPIMIILILMTTFLQRLIRQHKFQGHKFSEPSPWCSVSIGLVYTLYSLSKSWDC